MTTAQTVIMISIGTLLIQPLVGKNIWATFGIAIILIVTFMLIEWIQMKWDFAETLFTGRSKVVIENGILNEKNLKKVRLSVDDLDMLLRQKGIESIQDVKWATFEPSGQLGYMLADQKKLATKEDLDALHQALNALAQQLSSSHFVQQPKQPSPDANSNTFTEVKNGYNPSRPERLQ
ncbi:DUF421 domain-containing protein [Bacillus xiapuensis]|uniref:DUF421 domain-containing protein n=1 Tax=Bacillus xiapuensis TaxID=2014075 RepID=UPI000C25103A|nr:YetF domain-containing protein [Bacillus xiapuensis]